MGEDTETSIAVESHWAFEWHPGKLTLIVRYRDLVGYPPIGEIFKVDKKEAMQMESEIHDALEPIFAARWAAQCLDYEALKAAVARREISEKWRGE